VQNHFTFFYFHINRPEGPGRYIFDAENHPNLAPLLIPLIVFLQRCQGAEVRMFWSGGGVGV
jgi:hypothetical protein